MFYVQMFGSRFERGVLGVLGAGALSLYILGAIQFAMPTDMVPPSSPEPVVAILEIEPAKPKPSVVQVRAPVQRVFPAPEIVHRPLFGRPPEVALVARIKSAGVALQVVSARDLDQKLAKLDYRLSDVRRGSAPVPRLQLANLPPDLAQIDSVKQRKRLFIKSILPLVLQANEKILKDRRRLLDLIEADGSISPGDRKWLATLGERYDTDLSDLETLVRRVDAVPASLAIAQAAEESGWGTSRFALEANAVFGQRTFRKGSGVVPERRDAGKRHEVRSFDGLRQSVAAYMHNLNIHWAYKEFRRVRHELRTANRFLAGHVLVGTLQKYSERGPKYIKTIRTIMRVNGLGAFDRARLQDLEGSGLGT